MLSSAAARRGLLRAAASRGLVLSASRGPVLSTLRGPVLSAPRAHVLAMSSVAGDGTPTVAAVIRMHEKLSDMDREIAEMHKALHRAKIDHDKTVERCKRQVGMTTWRKLVVGGSFLVIISTFYRGLE